MTPADLYRQCKVRAWRLETLQDYPGDEDERRRAFLAGEPLPPPGPGKQADLDLMAGLVRAGIRLQRVHLISRPPTDYMRFELAVYGENAAAGEDVRIADLSAHPALPLLGDLAVFDAGSPAAAVILFRYNRSGTLLGYEHITDPHVIRAAEKDYTIALSCSVPLDQFMAAVG